MQMRKQPGGRGHLGVYRHSRDVHMWNSWPADTKAEVFKSPECVSLNIFVKNVVCTKSYMQELINDASPPILQCDQSLPIFKTFKKEIKT